MADSSPKPQTGIDRIGGLSKALEFAYKSEIDGDYVEFGVWKGVSLLRAMQLNQRWQQRTGRRHIEFFVGFDSFEGLPTLQRADELTGYKVFYEGQFSDTSLEGVSATLVDNGFPADSFALVPGFYEESLTDPAKVGKFSERPAAVVHIDCDLYSSALDCLDYAGNVLQDGAVLLFDDWYCYRGRPDKGVNKALKDWLEVNRGFAVSEYFSYSWAGKAFIVHKD